ncbi:bifunctional 4-hydroxy-2-oxoglutarate aldolase/2-dehydro-3-deoxy-phosphogluconate aldolase [Pseudahrensia aquimaris]|uniref:2-dehydro-3-deoxy-phosphogluconate aldolase n=1 Tax=Pseudahrensia aquimaris TaxID=744461 RepID=A0ABW3FBS9_9HYPH
MKTKSERIRQILALGPVVPVLAFDDVDDAIETSRALVAGGLPVIEITLRTPVALKCISAVAKHVDGAVVGAGTVLNRAMMKDCVSAGAQFLVSPGATIDLIDGLRKIDIPLLPGVCTPSEAMGLYAEGIDTLKFFPAEQSGGAGFLKSLAPVLPEILFCPTGGINAKTAPDYLKLPNVACVGGSWVAPAGMIADKDWDGITKLAAEAVALG